MRPTTITSALLAAATVALLVMGAAAPASAQDKFTDCPHKVDGADIYVSATLAPADDFSVAALKKRVTKIIKKVRKDQADVRCVVVDDDYKLQTTGKDEIWVLWWFNTTNNAFGWVAARQVADRVYILESAGSRGFVNADEATSSRRTSFNLHQGKAVTHKLKVTVKHPGGPAPKGDTGRFDYKVQTVAE